MQKMRIFLLISLIAIATFQSGSEAHANRIKSGITHTKREKSRQYPLKITVDILKQTGEPFYYRMIINNQSKTNFAFWMMACSKEDNLVVNTSSIQFYGRDCDSNYPQLYELKPNEKQIIEGRMGVYLSSIKKEKNIRMGLVLVERNDYHYSDERSFGQVCSSKNIIWSEPIHYKW